MIQHTLLPYQIEYLKSKNEYKEIIERIEVYLENETKQKNELNETNQGEEESEDDSLKNEYGFQNRRGIQDVCKSSDSESSSSSFE
mmetsp:Transcript_11501/g.20787  ORF Transcript_11501/g.20787 Transcript_11501/m.20787 type:complete len:86 (+) Transcript_11501:4086-4343(+)